MMLTSLLIQVRIWLMQPHVWRFVGFASSVVALLCYALSSSFNHLFGDWKLWKICLYTVVSCIFCFAVLFARVWHPSNSHWLKAHMAFLVLTVTSVYSFFYDKKVNGKPDAHGLISCAAFAVMSLSLSKQTHFGFEVDLLYFFLGVLTVQLMKIEVLLGIVGVCFSYSLIVLRCSLNAQLESGPEIQEQHHVTAFIDIAQYFRTNFNQIARHVSCFVTFANFDQFHRNVSFVVTFVSTVAGLFSFALSSSFNHLFGDWNLSKICVYSFLSFIFVAVLFAKVGQKPHIMQYIFLLQNLMRKNPEAYTFAFWVTIVSMSFLMSSHMLEETARAGFTSSPLGLEIQDQHHVTVQVNSHSQAASCTDIAVIMPQLTACMESFKTNNRKVIDILSMHVGEYIEADDDLDNKDLIPIDNNLVIDALQSEIVNDPSEVVKLMVTGGFEQGCCHVYSSYRREFLQQFLIGLTLLPLDGRDLAKMDPMYLGFHVESWTKSINIATRVLFPNEKRLCECFFSGFTSAADLAFMDVCRELTISLLNFANCFAVESSAPNLLAEIPKVFGTLHDLIPEFESLFSEPPNHSLRNEAINTCRRLEKATKGIFTEFENRICHDRAMADFLGGLYPISRDVMYFLCGVSKARIFLEKVFHENPLAAGGSEGTFSSVSMQIAKIMELLDSHLEVKSKNYNDPALHYFSMMNNGRYIEQRVMESNALRNILGDDWIRKHTTEVQQNLEDYQRSSWDKVLHLMKLDGNDESITAESMIENPKMFNMQFKEICRVQSTCFVLDEQLREETRNFLEKILQPAYGNFIEKMQTILGSQANTYIEYSMHDIDALLDDLYQGSHWRISSWKRRFETFESLGSYVSWSLHY